MNTPPTKEADMKTMSKAAAMKRDQAKTMRDPARARKDDHDR